MDNKKLIEFIKKWNVYCEHITLSTIYSKLKANGQRVHVLNCGPPGSGKTRSTLELLNELSSGEEIFLDNTTTEKGLFETFQEYPEHDIILDECSTLLRNPKSQDMLKTAMEGRSLVWTKDGEMQITDPYEGSLIINTNNKIIDTVTDRCFVNKTVMNKDMNLAFNKDYWDKQKSKEEFKPFLDYINKKIDDDTLVELDEKERNYILEFTQQNVEDLEKAHYSRRILLRMVSFYTHTKKLFGKILDEEVLGFVEPIAKTYISNDQTPDVIGELVGSKGMEKPLLVKTVAKELKYTEQHARRLINQKISSGELKLVGKLVVPKKDA